MWNVGAQATQQQAQPPGNYSLIVADPSRVKVGQAVPPQTVMQSEIEEVNITPIIGAFQDLNLAMKISGHNPYDPKAQQAILRARRTLEMLRQSPPPAAQPWIGAVVEPFAQALNLMVPAVREGLRIRVEQAERMLQQPTIAIPLNFDLAPGQESTSIENKNPYLGSGPANYDGALWAITAIETPPSFVIQGCCGPGPNILITELTFAGHDYVRAGLQGITNWPGNTGRLAGTQGYPIWMFSADKTYRRATAFRPWNLSGAEGIVGAVMRETGSFNIRVRNANAQPCSECPFLDSIIIHVSASLCGMPWSSANLAKMYMPLAMQAQAALSLGSFQARMLGKQFDTSLMPQLQAMLKAQSALSSGDMSLLDMGQGYDTFLP